MKKHIIIALLFAFVGAQIATGQTKKQEVYRTKKGEKYHKKECRIIKEKDTLKILLKDAKKKGLVACKVCHPSGKNKVIKEKKSTNKTRVPSKKSIATRCTGTTQKGTQCKRMTKNANGRCWQH